jgi:hypothetical protein
VCENLVYRDAGPRVPHGLYIRTTVHVDDRRIFPGRIEAGRLDQTRVEWCAIRAFELDYLRGQNLELI